MSVAPDKSSQEWGAQWAQGLWDGLFARHDPLIDGQVVLDLGCNWGYTLKFFAEHFRPAKLIGVDLRPTWRTLPHGWGYELLGGLVEFHEGHFAEMDQLDPATVDLIVSSSTFQYMTPEEAEASAAKAYSLLRPGGEAIIRTRTAGSHIGADLHMLFGDAPYAHLLYGRPAIEQVSSEANRRFQELNFLTASSYLAIFMRCGFEVIDATRRLPSVANRPELAQRVREQLPGVSDQELFCADLDVRLVRPIDPKDLPGLAPA
jgi:SAM-dependent methyltransferase